MNEMCLVLLKKTTVTLVTNVLKVIRIGEFC